MFAHFHWSSITSIFYTFKRLGKYFFWVGEVRSGSEGLCHYINIYFYLSIIKLKIKNNHALGIAFCPPCPPLGPRNIMPKDSELG